MSDAAPAPSGSSILTSGIPPPSAPANGNGGNPAAGQPSATAEAIKAAARPEWVPEKYWKADKNEPDYEGLGKGYINLEQLLGRDKIPKPLNDEDQEGWDRWYAASGRPEKPDAYEFKRPDKLPDGLGYDEELEQDFRATAYGMGLNKKQATGLYEKFVTNQVKRYEAFDTSKKQARAEAEANLQREYGHKYDSAISQAKVAMANYADPEFRQYLEQTGMGNDPRMIRMMIRIGQEMQGDTRAIGKPQVQVNSGDIERTIREFESKNRSALYDKSHPDHAALVKERNRLYETKFGDE